MLHVIAMGAVVVTAIGQGQVQAVGSSGARRERHDRFQPQLVDRTGPIRADEFIQLATDEPQVRTRLGRADMIFTPDQAHGLPFGGLFQEEVCHQRGSGVKVHDPVGIDDQRAVTIRVKPQVDAGFFARTLAAVVINPCHGVRSLLTSD